MSRFPALHPVGAPSGVGRIPRDRTAPGPAPTTRTRLRRRDHVVAGAESIEVCLGTGYRPRSGADRPRGRDVLARVVALHGEFDLANAPAFRSACCGWIASWADDPYRQAADRPDGLARIAVVDAADLAFMDTTAFEVVAELAAGLAEHHIATRIVLASSCLRALGGVCGSGALFATDGGTAGRGRNPGAAVAGEHGSPGSPGDGVRQTRARR